MEDEETTGQVLLDEDMMMEDITEVLELPGKHKIMELLIMVYMKGYAKAKEDKQGEGN